MYVYNLFKTILYPQAELTLLIKLDLPTLGKLNINQYNSIHESLMTKQAKLLIMVINKKDK